jgi:hypothetical protein
VTGSRTVTQFQTADACARAALTVRAARRPALRPRDGRLSPALVAGLPAAAVAGARALSDDPAIRVLGLLSGAIGLAVSAFVRTAGRNLEPSLWQSWGGSPTVRRLRWRGAVHRPGFARLQAAVEAVLGESLPNEPSEIADPDAADRAYEDAVRQIRGRTRDAKRFKLLFAENADYGFRRNSLGIRPYALAIAVAAGLISLVMIAADRDDWSQWGVCIVISTASAFYWWKIVTPN